MRRAAVALIAIVVLVLLAVNLFLASSMGRGMVAQKVSAAMRLPVTLESASYTPWSGARLKGLRVEQVEAAQSIVDDPFFSAASFSADVRLLSLLSDEVVIDRLVCDSPTISLVRGQRLVRRPTPAPQVVAAQEKKVSESETGGASSQRTRTNPRARKSEPVEKKKRRKLAIGEVEVRGGTLIITSTNGLETMRVEGLKMVVDLSQGNGEEKVGRLSFDRGRLFESLEITEFSSPMQMEGRRMNLSALSASCEGGSISGEIVIEPSSQQSRFSAKLSATAIEIASILEGKVAAVKSGRVSGTVALQGDANRLETIQGGGTLRLDSAALAPDGEFARLRSAMEVDAQGNVRLDPAEASFAIRGGVLGLQEASFGSGRVLVKSVGGIRHDGKLNVAVRLYLGGGLYSAMRSKPVPERGLNQIEFLQLEGTDWFYRDELLGGNLRNPMVDFWRTGKPVPAWDVVRDLSFDFDEVETDAIGR